MKKNRPPFDLDQEFEKATLTICLKGLPPYTTEPAVYSALLAYSPQEIRLVTNKETGDCKGIAFVQFSNLEDSCYFVKSFAGSVGDPDSPVLKIHQKFISLEFTRDLERKSSNISGQHDSKQRRDWICQCGYQNFARRSECLRCHISRIESEALQNPFSEKSLGWESPGQVLVGKGFVQASHEQVTQFYRQFAPVQSVFMVNEEEREDEEEGLALVWFSSIEEASFARQASDGSQFNGWPIRSLFAKPSFVQIQLSLHTPLPTSPLPLPPSIYSSTQITLPTSHSRSSRPLVPPSFPLSPPPGLPRPFEQAGGQYSFQPCGLFLDLSKGYFYCPKSKLYYNSDDGNYLSHTPHLSTPFTPFSPPPPTDDIPTIPQPASSPLPPTPTVPPPKIQVSLNLKKKTLLPSASKKVEADIAKWSTLSLSLQPSRPLEDPSLGWVCLLCRRKFSDSEQLNRHGKESQLHSKNLSRIRSQSKSSHPQYRDRASERRAKRHGADISFLLPEPSPLPPYPSPLPSSQAEPPPTTLLEDRESLGNQILKKMGWREGGGLGREEQGHKEALGVQLAEKRDQSRRTDYKSNRYKSDNN